MGNVATLKKGNPATQFKTGEKQVKIATLGGIKSGEAKRKKKTYRELAESMFNARPDEKTTQYIKKVFPQLNDDEIILKVLHLVKLHEKILKGDTRAFELLRDTTGEKPVDKTEVKGEGFNFNNIDLSSVTTKELEKYVEKLKGNKKKK